MPRRRWFSANRDHRPVLPRSLHAQASVALERARVVRDLDRLTDSVDNSVLPSRDSLPRFRAKAGALFLEFLLFRSRWFVCLAA